MGYFSFCITSSCHIELVGQSAADWRDSRTIFLQDWPRVSVGKMRGCCCLGCCRLYSPFAWITDRLKKNKSCFLVHDYIITHCLCQPLYHFTPSTWQAAVGLQRCYLLNGRHFPKQHPSDWSLVHFKASEKACVSFLGCPCGFSLLLSDPAIFPSNGHADFLCLKK